MISFFPSGLSALLPLCAAPSSVRSAELREFVGAVARSSSRRLGRMQLESPAIHCFQNSAHWPKRERTSLKSSTRQKWLKFDRKINDDTAFLLSSAYYEHIVFSLAAEFISLMWNAVGRDSNHKVKRKVTCLSQIMLPRALFCLVLLFLSTFQ